MLSAVRQVQRTRQVYSTGGIGEGGYYASAELARAIVEDSRAGRYAVGGFEFQDAGLQSVVLGFESCRGLAGSRAKRARPGRHPDSMVP